VRSIVQRSDEFRDQVVAVGFAVRATAVNAACNWEGNCFPRFSARRRMPLTGSRAQKVPLRHSPSSKTCHNEHTAALLGHSEELSVKNSVGEPIPEFCQPPEEGSKRPSSVI
jgi:hypothetical protein